MKIKWLSNSVIILSGVIILGIISSAPSLILFMSDAYFLISILLLIIGLLGWVLRNGTFDFFHYSLNRAKQALFNRQKHPDHKENIHHLSGSISTAYKSFIKAGILFLASSTLCILAYYFL